MIQFKDLRPYKSFTLFKLKRGTLKRGKLTPAGLRRLPEEARSVIQGAVRGTKTKVTSFEVTKVRKKQHQGKSGVLASIQYTLRQPVTWSRAARGPFDLVHHLVIFLGMENLLAICASDSSLSLRFIAAAQDTTYKAWSSLLPVSSLQLNALLRDRPARTLWLSGLHRPVPMKADNKVLSGSDLRETLNPGDQTYHFTAVRSGGYSRALGVDVIGVSPRKAMIWIGPSHDWKSFTEQIFDLLKLIRPRIRAKTPLPILAVEVESTTDVKEAFDVALLPPEILGKDDTKLVESVEKWLQYGSWSIVKRNGPNFSLSVKYGGERLGTVKVELRRSPDGWRPVVTCDPKRNARLKEFAKLCKQRHLLKVCYDSQHTYSDGALFRPGFRDLPFIGFRSYSFKGIDIDREKPYRDPKNKSGEDPERIGERGDRSLFTWCFRKFRRGWLWCDDGAGEVADFIHLDPHGTLRLIHVKAAGSRDPNRQISVSPYEVVCSQALKNLRYMEVSELRKKLKAKLKRAKIKRAWKNGKIVKKADWFKLRNAINLPYSQLSKEIVIVQPHVTSDMLRSNNPQEKRRLPHLYWLLNSVKAEVNRLGATFAVYAPKSRRPA